MKRAILPLFIILMVTGWLVYWGPVSPVKVDWGKAVYNIDRVDKFYVHLDGNDTDWIDVGLNTTYTFYNVSKGDHTFHLLVVDANGSSKAYSKNLTKRLR